MPARAVVLGAALLFIGILATLTVVVVVSSGISVLVVLSLVVLGMLAVGIVGALRQPPPDD